jgi:hypothetical protein
MRELQKPHLSNGTYRWKFFRAGGLNQVLFRNGQDIAHLPELDQKLWVMLSAPTRGVMFDPRTLDLVDTDEDGRIRAPELLAAVAWTVARLNNPDDLMKGAAALPLEAIHADTPEGAQILTTARRILANVGKPDATVITVTDINARVAALSQMRFNGDGIMPPESVDDETVRQALRDILACVGGEKDRCGKPGVSEKNAELFFQDCTHYAAWHDMAAHDPSLRPLGDDTEKAAEAWQIVRAKLDDYFTRCRLETFNPNATDVLNSNAADFAAITRGELTLASPEIARLPLSHTAPHKPLPLREGLNPFWNAAVETFRVHTAEPLLGRPLAALAESDWQEICNRLTPHANWLAAKTGAAVEKLGLPRVRELLASDMRSRIEALIRQDTEQECEHTQTEDVEKLIRLHADLLRLLNNFVSFSDFYDPTKKEIFRVGRLCMDSRWCDLCLHVDNVEQHSQLITTSRLFLAYCEIIHPPTKEKRTICAAFTAGMAESLWVGRHGIFYDRENRCWEAVIVKVVEGPISLKEAFWMPWRKISALLADQVRKILSSRQHATLQAAEARLENTGAVLATKPAATGTVATPSAARFTTPAPMDGAALASSVAAIGIAVGLVGSAVSGIVSMASGLPLWKTLLGVAAVILAVSGPAVVLAYFKLRNRDLGPVLNACGWAVNSRIGMTMPLGRVFTQEARLPEGVERSLIDPYADKNGTRNTLIAGFVIAVILLILWSMNLFDRFLPHGLKHAEPSVTTTVIVTTNAPTQTTGAAMDCALTNCASPRATSTNTIAR